MKTRHDLVGLRANIQRHPEAYRDIMDRLAVDERCNRPKNTQSVWSWAEPDENGDPQWLLVGESTDDLKVVVASEWLK